MDLKFGPAFSSEESNSFAVVFDVSVLLEEGLIIETRYFSVFEAEAVITEEDRESHFVRANAAAIAFPFLRAFLAQTTLMAGHKPIVIPSVNFAQLWKDPDSRLELESQPLLEMAE